ncbi:MAG: hypothetical protein AVDCRST_MAG28-512 [uncultured Rubrobacteraceae bacterium]|uniref:Uncharacterized protein n=1 Tax=uncultured Rubrobacteraceae bacterium TaxID=349277 RepID=A0A6J4QE46_9ACTN|nr:MAG: hypothetical protein AVDCRST_MAG28-512 [uncultured Rubrobacteraceae bacterium]
MVTRRVDGRGGHHSGFFRAQAAGAIVLILVATAFLTSCANLNLDGETTDGDTTAEGGATDNGTTIQDGTMVEDTTVMEETATTEETATMEETMMKESTTKGGETTAESTTRGGGTTEGTNKSSSTVATGEAITDVRTIITEQDKQFLVGRRVRLREAGVRSVINAQSFLLGPSDTRQIFAVLEGEQAQGAGVTAGETLSVDGEIRQLPSTEDARQRFGVTETEAALLQSQEIYLSVDRLEVTQR